MHILVTGAAGFIGSTLSDRLLAAGHRVTGVDSFHPYYDRSIKERNATGLMSHPEGRLLELDLAQDDLTGALEDVDGVIHLAAQAGVRASWGETFQSYLDANVRSTQRLLEASRDVKGLRAWVYASSASVYGDDATEAVDESRLPAPHSPYGVTKLAGEHLVHLYRKNHGLPTLSLRYFSVYGPRERPDKAIQKFLHAARAGRGIDVYGDGRQQRDFTFVGDVVAATQRALEQPPVGETLNIARGHTEPLSAVIDAIREVTGSELPATYTKAEAGDVRVTSARIDAARRHLDYDPQTDLRDGIAAQWEEVCRWA